jgi:hypothetical protein
MTDRVTSYLRTAVPLLWGYIVTQLVALGLPDPITSVLESPQIATAITALVTLLWYFIWRTVEHRLPAWFTALVLGSNATPTYKRDHDLAA